jgi:hypothetical protein
MLLGRSFDGAGSAMAVLVLTLAFVLAGRGATSAQQKPKSPCVGAAFHAFDYWVGHWVVRDAKGAVVGHSHVSSVSDGCAVLEQWTDASGGTGTSINFFTPADSTWRQVWVGGGGLILHLEGNPNAGVMALEDSRKTRTGAAVMDRIRWIPRDSGRVEQLWETSTDGGASWKASFQGFYVPVKPSGTASDTMPRLTRPSRHHGE